jgi:hypothetical protein
MFFSASFLYEIFSLGSKISSFARASSSGIVVLSDKGVQNTRQCWLGCALRGRARHDGKIRSDTGLALAHSHFLHLLMLEGILPAPS